MIKVLLVDDHEIAFDLEKLIIESFGFEVHKATNGEDAIKLIIQNNYDIVFMDTVMPTMDGFATAQRIRKFNKKTPIIAMSLDEITSDDKKFKDAEMNGVLLKPVTIYGVSKIIKLCNEKYFGENKVTLQKKFVRYVNDENLKNFMPEEKALMQMLYQFILTHNEDCDKLQNFINNKEFEKARILLNKIIGMAGNLYAFKLFDASRYLVVEIKRGESSSFESFKEVWGKTIAEIAQLCNILAMKKETSPLELKSNWNVVWEDFCDLCKDFDTSAVMLFTDNRRYFLTHLGLEKFNLIRKAINKYDFIWLQEYINKEKSINQNK